MKIVIVVFSFLIIFTGCSDNSEDEISCELKLKIMDNQDNNLLETGFYNSDTIFLFQDNLEYKYSFDYDNVEYVLSISTVELRNYNMDNDFLLYLNMSDTDTLKINYERDPSVPCLGGGLIIKGLKYNGLEITKLDDYYIILK